MTLDRTKTFKRYYKKLPDQIKDKLDRQLIRVAVDFQHPSLHTKKIKGKDNIWEARVDIHYRFTFRVIDDVIRLRKVGPHDILQNP